LTTTPEETVPEPPPRRRRPRTALRTRRIRTIIVLAAVVVVAVAVPLLVLKATRTIANSKAGRSVTSVGPGPTRLPDTPAAMLVAVAPDRTVAGIAVMARDGSGSGGTVVVVPAGAEVPAVGGAHGARLAAAYQTGGLAAQREALEGVFGITTSLSAEADEAVLTELLTPYAPLQVTLDDQALDTGPDGHEVVLYPPGRVELSAAQAAHLLVARGPNESEIARLPRSAAIWTAVVSSGRRPPSPAPGSIDQQLATLARGTSTVRTLPVRPVLDAIANPDGADLLRPDNAGTKLLLAEAMPGAVSPANDHIRLRVVNASGDPAMLAEAVGRLVYVGANIVIVGQPSTTSQQTVIEYQAPQGEAEAKMYVPVVSASTVRLGDDSVDGIDATIVLGQDFVPFLHAEQSTTTIPNTSTSGP
jgi:hypothetical protein